MKRNEKRFIRPKSLSTWNHPNVLEKLGLHLRFDTRCGKWRRNPVILPVELSMTLSLQCVHVSTCLWVLNVTYKIRYQRASLDFDAIFHNAFQASSVNQVLLSHFSDFLWIDETKHNMEIIICSQIYGFVNWLLSLYFVIQFCHTLFVYNNWMLAKWNTFGPT